MKNKRLRQIVGIIIFIITILPNFAFADKENKINSSAIVCLGEDLTNEQKSDMLRIFGFENMEDIDIIQVSNEEERKYLGGYIDASKIGTRAISSVYVEKLKKGAGIDMELHNITWVTGEMYKNAAITAGIEDAKIVVASPFGVSGTSALTGIIKSFEDITGEKIGEEIKDLANQEMAVMGDLKDIIGDKKTMELIVKAKKEILKNDYVLDTDIQKVVVNIINQLNIELKKEDIQKVVDFLKKLSTTNVDKSNILKNIKAIKIDSSEVKGLFAWLKAFFMKLFS